MVSVMKQMKHWLLVAPLAVALSGTLHAETVARYGISMADIPLTTGQPDRGAGAYQFTGHTIYDPLIAWEANIGTRPGKLVPGLATEWKVDPKDHKVWRFDAMFEAIGELEAACARHAAVRMTEAERAAMRHLHAQGREAMRARNLDHYDALNRELHLVILHGAHNPVLTDTALTLRHRVAPFRRTQFRNLERIAASFAEHSAIVEAVLACDAVAAHREMRNHLLSARGAAARLAPAWSPRTQAPA